MRFPSKYLCTLLNRARHHAFGRQAAEFVLQNLPPDWPKVFFRTKPLLCLSSCQQMDNTPYKPDTLEDTHTPILSIYLHALLIVLQY